MGRISVNVVPDSADSTAALVFCGKELRRIKLLASLETLEHQILEPVSAPILLTSREDVRICVLLFVSVTANSLIAFIPTPNDQLYLAYWRFLLLAGSWTKWLIDIYHE